MFDYGVCQVSRIRIMSLKSWFKVVLIFFVRHLIVARLHQDFFKIAPNDVEFLLSGDNFRKWRRRKTPQFSSRLHLCTFKIFISVRVISESAADSVQLISPTEVCSY